MIGGIYFAGAPFAGMLRAAGAAAAALAGSASLTFTTAGQLDLPPSYLAGTAAITWTTDGALDNPPAYLAGDATIEFDTAGQLIVPIETGAGISIGGVDVTGRVRVSGLTVHDILNDAPNTATFTIEGDAPAVGQRVRIVTGNVLLFTGAVQTIDQAYESLPKYLAWHISAIDDTAEANARRPFGTWFDTSATTIAQAITTTFTTGFSTAGIQAGLENVTIVFDGADPFIQCLTRLATAVGGYCKIEDHVVYLFTEDLSAPPDPLDDAHRFLASPPITVNTDSSQLRTRVYGKGYGEHVLADIAAGETLLPIPDGALFPPLGGLAILGLTPDGAQSDKILFTSVSRPTGGTLVGPGAAPANAPTLGLAAGGVVTSGLHEVAVVHVTAAGKSLAGPRGGITTGAMPAPTTALTANTAINGTGPDQGYHEYVVTNLMLGGETTPGPVSNSVSTSAASGQISPPTQGPWASPQSGAGAEDGQHDYLVTFTTAQGETQAGPGGAQIVTLAPILTGQLPTPTGSTVGTAQQGTGVDTGSHSYGVTFLDANGETPLGAQGNPVTAQSVLTGNLPTPSNSFADEPVTPLTPGNLSDDINAYYYKLTYTNAVGETDASLTSNGADAPALPTPASSPGGIAANVAGGGLTLGTYFYWVSFLTTSGYETAITVNSSPVLNTAGENAVSFNSLPISTDARVTKRNLYRSKVNELNSWSGYLVATFNDNTTRTYVDKMADASLPAGSIYWEPGRGTPAGPRGTKPGWQARIYNLPTGPAGTTGRKLYRTTSTSGQSSAYRLIAGIADNSTTQYIDNIPAASEGAAPPPTNTTGTNVPWNQILVTNIPAGPAGTTGRRLYRNPNTGQFRYLADIPGNLTTSYVDTKPTAQLGVVAPTGNTTGSMVPNNQISVSNIQTGPAGTTGRRLYRRFNQSGTYRFVTAIGDTTTTTYTDTKSNGALGADAPTSNTTGTAVQRVPLIAIPLGPGGTTGRNLYRRYNGGGAFRFLTTLANNTTTTFSDTVPNASLGANAPATNTAVGNMINMTQIPTGGSTVTSREVYMTLAGGGTLYLALTLADNTTRDATLNLADASLAGQPQPPALDTSGLQQPQGQVTPGSTSLIVASPGPFVSTGGWAITGGGQVIRYTGISGQLLTGVPATGAGAIVTTILYGQQATPAPTLVGVSGLTRPMLKGSAVHIWVQRDDLVAQAEQAARTGGNGIVEFLIVDQRRGVESLVARCDADLALFSRPIVTVGYATRDLKTKSGKPIVINLPSQRLATTLTIQDVTVTEIDIATGLPPRFTVKASSVRFSLEDTLRRLIAVGPVTVNT